VLVVDDDRLALERLRELLEPEGLEVLLAQSAEEALRVLERQTVHLALLDVLMPGEPGDVLCRRIRQSERDWALPVVMVTSSDAQQTVRRCFVAGADGFIVKPVLGPELAATVRALRAAREAPPLGPKKRVLLASDKPFFSHLVGNLLRASGHEVFAPRDAAAAQELLAQSLATLDLAIVDLDFGGAAAGGLVAAIQSRPQKLPMVAVARAPGSASLPPELAALGAFDAETEIEHAVRQSHRLLSNLSGLRDRRSSARVPFHAVVRYRIWGEREWLSGYAYDLCETGVFVRSLSPLEATKPVEVSFRLEDRGTELGAKGLVIWSNPPRPRSVQTFPYGMGVVFSEFPIDDWAAVRDFIARSAPRTGDKAGA
jgi:CheY-like chemotaxis protein